MSNYRISIIAEVKSSLTRRDLESKLVTSLFNYEIEVKISDGDSKQFEVVDYELIEATPIIKNKNGG
jgi:hypothetical protein